MIEQAVGGKRRFSRQYVAIFAVALVFRLAFVAFYVKTPPPDTDGYFSIATNLVSGDGYALVPGEPTAYRPPVYPLFLAAVLRMGGGAMTAIWTQSVLQAFVVLIAAWLTRRIIGDLFALAAACFVAVDPYSIAQCGQLMSEGLFALMIAAALALFVRALRARSPGRYAVAGLVAGAAAMTRPEFLVFVPGAVVAASFWGRRRNKSVCIAAFLIASLVLPALWARRNHRALGRWIFTTTHGGYTHRLAYNDVFYSEVVSGRSKIWSAESLESWQRQLALETAGLSELERDRWHYEAAAEFVRAGRLRAARVALFEIARFWSPVPQTAGGVIACGLGGYFLIMVGLAAVGLYVAWRTHPTPLLVAVLLACETLVHAYYWSNVRMRVPFHPLLAVMAAVGLATLFGRKVRAAEPVNAARENTLYSPAV